MEGILIECIHMDLMIFNFDQMFPKWHQFEFTVSLETFI